MISKMRVRVCIFDTCVNEEDATGLRNEDRNRLALLRGHEKVYNWIEYLSRKDSGKIKIIAPFFQKLMNEKRNCSSHNIYIQQLSFFKN